MNPWITVTRGAAKAEALRDLLELVKSQCPGTGMASESRARLWRLLEMPSRVAHAQEATATP